MEKVSKRVADLRANFNALKLKSDFITADLSAIKLPQDFTAELQAIQQNTQYEELVCVSYRPENHAINATVKIKQNTGYGGSECGPGSYEYVRFYVDYDRNGTWVDEGVANFNAHDLGFDDDLCYNVSMQITPDKRRCCDKKPVLPRVRAILSWNTVPPPNTPNWNPFWGNALETNIQIEPLHGLLCALDDLDLVPNFNTVNTALNLTVPKALKKNFSIKESLEFIQKNKVEASRFTFPTFIKKIQASTLTPIDLKAYPSELKLDYSSIVDFLLKPKFNTTYEELTCVALNRSMETLHGTVRIKRAAGYSGNLCQDGSKEHIAFYMDFGSGWEYMGNSSVTVHNIPQIPNDGLDYNVVLPVDLDSKKKEWCESGKAKLKGILSWNVAPPANQPNYVSHWGDWEQCDVEIKSLPKDTTDQLSLNIETLGSMHVDDINQTTGLADGLNALGLGFVADQSPFDGTINFTGSLINGGGTNLEYRFVVFPPSSGSFPIKNHVTAEKIGFTGPETLIPDVDGWMPFTKFVGNFLGFFKPTDSGLHTVEIQVRNAVSNVIIPTGNVINFMVHKQGPVVDVEITSGTGNCGSFAPGDIIQGTYSIVTDYPRVMSFNVTPHPESNPGVISIDGVAVSSLSYPASLVAPGRSGVWQLATNTMPQCGYNIRLTGHDRTIMHSKNINRHSADIEGFCLIPQN